MLKKINLLLLLPLLMGCEDATDKLFPEPQPVNLPAETQRGANTFGCRMNGQTWEANNTSTLMGHVLTPNIHYRHGELRIDAFRRLQVVGPVTNFYFTAAHVTGPGVYPLGATQPENSSGAKLETTNSLVEYSTDAKHTGTLTITRLDTTGVHPFIAGRFELRAVPHGGSNLPTDFPAELLITEGRFDIQLRR
ncbi:hypothetical protein [Hymenobacter terrenus]|uniref:hypothetical protein n=1 Tax=Hymenobacter terrenus TaxID=1629124 RepID=UPI000619AD1D|nr:hypothetical protein [Hymenobacter terrenus]